MKASSERLAAGCLGIATAILGCLAPAHSDTWWLLRAGREIVVDQHIPLVDSYSWTAAGLPWPNHEWLSEATFFLAHQIAGMPGLALLTAALISTAGIVSWRLAEGSFEVRFVSFAIGLVGATTVFAMRPQVFTLAAFSVTCLLLRRDRLLLLPALELAWVNFHGAAVLGVVAVGAAFLSDLISRADRINARRLRTFAMVAAAVALATLASPLGVRLWTFIPESTARLRASDHVEWAGPDLSPEYVPFWLAAAAVLALALGGWRRLPLHQRRVVAVAIAMLPLAVQSMRNVPLFLLAALPAITMLAAARASGERAATPRRARENERLNGAILIAAGTLAGLGIALVWWRPPPPLGWNPMSVAAAHAVASCPAPLYNVYGKGGEIIWFVPEKRVFLDNRQDPYPMALLEAARKLETDGQFRGLFAEHGIQCAAVPPDSTIARSLRAAPEWSVNYEDDQWLVMTPNRAR